MRKQSKRPKRVVILGPEGSGKGTQAERLARRLSVPAVSMGALLRAAMRRPTPLGRKVARLMGRGTYLPDAVVNEVLFQWFRRPSSRRGFVLDGFPRRLGQLRTLDRLTDVDAVVSLELPDRTAVARLGGRRIGPDGTVYHLRYAPPPKSLPRSQLRRRHDDEPDQIRGRLRAFHRLTAPVLRAYERRGILHRIDARPPIPTVAKRIAERLLG